jgi:hypothetical protein
MSNQKIDFYMMTVMTQYVKGEKPYTFLELKGAVEFASLMLENSYKIEETSEYSKQSDIFNIGIPAQEPVQEDTEEDFQEYAQECVQENVPQIDEKSIVKNRKTRNVWPKAFCEEVKTEFATFLKDEQVTPRIKVHKHFFKLFGHKLNAEDKLYPEKSTVANWQEKVDDNMKTWFINTKYCSYINSTYTYLGLVENQQTNFQKTFEM